MSNDALKENVVSLRYLIPHVPGISLEKLEIIFKSDSAVNSLALDMKDNLEFLTIFHESYNKIKNSKISINEGLIRRIKLMDDFYYQLIDNKNDLNSRIKNSVVLSEEEVEKKLEKRLQRMSKNGLEGYPYKDEVIMQRLTEGEFSLNEILGFNNEYGDMNELNAVTLITPSQTISRFNLKDKNGFVGAGGHDATFDEITKAVYGQKVFGQSFDISSGQDIKIRYINSFKSEEQSLMIIVEVPFPINSTQKKVLEILNYELKKYQLENGVIIDIYSGINDYHTDTHGVVEVNDGNNLDDLISKVIVDDNFTPKYRELYLIGHKNGINHFNDSTYKINGEVRTVRR